MKAVALAFDVILGCVATLGLISSLALYFIGALLAFPGRGLKLGAGFFAMRFSEMLDEVLDRER